MRRNYEIAGQINFQSAFSKVLKNAAKVSGGVFRGFYSCLFPLYKASCSVFHIIHNRRDLGEYRARGGISPPDLQDPRFSQSWLLGALFPTAADSASNSRHPDSGLSSISPLVVSRPTPDYLQSRL